MSDNPAPPHIWLDAISEGPSLPDLWLRVRAGGFVLREAE
jgi:hypothetical protein